MPEQSQDKPGLNSNKKEGGGCFQVVGGIIIMSVLFLVLGSLAGGNKAGAPVSPASEKTPPKSLAYDIKPEQIIKFKPGTLACNTKDDYKELIGHIVAKEETLAKGMLSDFKCVMIPSHLSYKVLKLDVAFVGTYVEFTPQDSADPPNEGMWTEGDWVSSIEKPTDNAQEKAADEVTFNKDMVACDSVNHLLEFFKYGILNKEEEDNKMIARGLCFEIPTDHEYRILNSLKRGETVYIEFVDGNKEATNGFWTFDAAINRD